MADLRLKSLTLDNGHPCLASQSIDYAVTGRRKAFLISTLRFYSFAL